MSNNKVFLNPNFQSGDSPKTIDILAVLGTAAVRTVSFINYGPGVAQVELSYDEGVTFEEPVFVSAALVISDGPLDGIDQIRVTHIGIDFDFTVMAMASSHSLVIMPIPAPEIYFGANYFEVDLLDGSTIDMAVDGSVTPVEYSYTVAIDERIRISQFVLFLEDGNSHFDSAEFADLGFALTNGVEISITPNGSSSIVLSNWKTNRDLRGIMSIFEPQTIQIGKSGEYRGIWHIANILSGGKGLFLNDGDKISLTVQDNLTALNFMGAKILGCIIFV